MTQRVLAATSWFQVSEGTKFWERALKHGGLGGGKSEYQLPMDNIREGIEGSRVADKAVIGEVGDERKKNQ